MHSCTLISFRSRPSMLLNCRLALISSWTQILKVCKLAFIFLSFKSKALLLLMSYRLYWFGWKQIHSILRRFWNLNIRSFYSTFIGRFWARWFKQKLLSTWCKVLLSVNFFVFKNQLSFILHYLSLQAFYNAFEFPYSFRVLLWFYLWDKCKLIDFS